MIYSLQQRLDLNNIPLLTRSNNITITVTRKARKAISLGWGITTSFRILPRQIVVFWRELSSYAKVHAAFGVSLRELPRLSQSVATLSSFTALTGNQIKKSYVQSPRNTTKDCLYSERSPPIARLLKAWDEPSANPVLQSDLPM